METQIVKLPKKIKPSLNNILVTSSKIENIESIIIDILAEKQTIIAVGPYVKEYKEGDLVVINTSRFKNNDGKLAIPTIRLGKEKTEYLLITDRDIDYTILEEEEVEIEVPTNGVLLENNTGLITNPNIINQFKP